MNVHPLNDSLTQQRLQQLFQETTRLVFQEVVADKFFAKFLPRAVQALAAVGGAVWQLDIRGLNRTFAVDWSETGIDNSAPGRASHLRLLLDSLSRQQPLLCAPSAQFDEMGEFANPTPFRILIVPLKVRREVVGLVELFQRPELDPSAQRGHLQLLVELCGLANQFLADRKLDEYARQEELWTRWAGFTQSVSAGLNSRDTAAVIVNEGRRIVGCDRLTMALRHGRRLRLTAISGQETFDRRATTVRLIEQLAGAVLAGSDPLWYTGEMDGLPPQVRTPLEAYLDVTPMQTVAALPLFRPRPGGHAGVEDSIGALIVECIEREGPNIQALRERAVAVRDVAGPALGNCLEHERLFLMPVWRAFGNATRLTERRTLPKTLAVVGSILLAVGLLTFVPADFELDGRGTLQPVERRDVFAEIDGDIQQVHIQHGTVVEPGDLLAQLRNVDLEVKVEDLKGQCANSANSANRAIHIVMSACRRIGPFVCADGGPIERERQPEGGRRSV